MTQNHRVTALKPTYYSGKRYEVGEAIDIDSTAHFEAYVRDGLVVEREGGVDAKQVIPETFDSPEGELKTLEGVFSTDVEDMTPDQYLKDFPEGPMSDVALRIVELRAELAETT